MYNVFIVDSADVPHGADADVECEVLRGCARVDFLSLNHESEFEPNLEQADAIILWHHLRFDAELIARLPRTRIIVRNGVGYDNVDVAAAAARGALGQRQDLSSWRYVPGWQVHRPAGSL